MNNTTKICSKCHVEKELEDFYVDSQKSDGYCSSCKDCLRPILKKYKTSTKGRLTVRNARIKRKELQLLRSARARAKLKNMEINIEEKDIIIPNICPILGIPIIKNLYKTNDNSPTIDRIDNTKGYVKGNVCVISKRANTIKNYGTLEEHKKIIEYMEKHFTKEQS